MQNYLIRLSFPNFSMRKKKKNKKNLFFELFSGKVAKNAQAVSTFQTPYSLIQ